MSCSLEYSIERDNFYDLASARQHQFKFDIHVLYKSTRILETI